MDIINDFMFLLLSLIKEGLDSIHMGGGYALSIILLTAGLRVLLWPLNSQQTRSMKKMQELQPKIKELQDKHKDNPQKMQEAMMKFYGDNKFNPLAGCLPMLVQLPIFIGLYGMLISPNFLAIAGGESFLFIDNLGQTLRSHAGETLDGTFTVKADDKFISAKKIVFDFKTGKSAEFKIKDNRKVLDIEPQPLIPGTPMVVNLKTEFINDTPISDTFMKAVKTAQLTVVNDATKEVEKLTFTPQEISLANMDPTSEAAMSAIPWKLSAEIPSEAGEDQFHLSVLWLILIYTLATVLYQKMMTKDTPKTPDAGPQAQMMKFMPFMFVGFLVFFPIPAGVILYLVVTMLLMFVQTAYIRLVDKKADEKNTPAPKQQVIEAKAD